MKLAKKLLDALKGNKEEEEIQEKVEILASLDNVEVTKKRAEVNQLKRTYSKLLWSETPAKTVVEHKIALEIATKQLEALEAIIAERYAES